MTKAIGRGKYRKLVHKKCGSVVEEAIYAGKKHWYCRKCKKFVRPVSVSL